jgi:hypothetical protein
MKTIKAIILLLVCISVTSFSFGQKIKLSKIENIIKLGSTKRTDLVSSLLKDPNSKVTLEGKSLSMLNKKMKIVLKDKNSTDDITVIFPKNDSLEFSISFTTKIINDTTIVPNFIDFSFESNEPIVFKKNNKKLVKLKSLNLKGNDIVADFKSISILNVLSLVFDEYIFKKNDKKNDFKVDFKLSDFPPFEITKLTLDLNPSTLTIGDNQIQFSNPYSVSIDSFSLSDNLNSFGLSNLNINLNGSELISPSIKFKIQEGNLNLKEYRLKLTDSGYFIEKSSENSEGRINLRNGSFNSESLMLSKGEFSDLNFILNDYKYECKNGNSIVSGGINVNATINKLENDKTRNSQLYYKLDPFKINNLGINYADDGKGKITRSINLRDNISLPFKEITFRKDGIFELTCEKINLSIAPTIVNRLEDIQLSLNNLSLSSSKVSINLIDKSLKMVFPRGVTMALNSDEVYLLKQSGLDHTTIKIAANVPEVIIKKNDQEQIEIKLINVTPNLTFTKNNNTTTLEGKFDFNTNSLYDNSAIISRYIPGARVSLDKIELSYKSTTQSRNFIQLHDLKISIPKETFIEKVNNLINTTVVKNYGKVADIKISVKAKIGPIKASKKVGSIGLYAEVQRANIHSLVFTNINKFDFDINGRVKLSCRIAQDTKNIRSAKGHGSISFGQPNIALNDLNINFITEAYNGQVDIENFPGVLENGIGEFRQILEGPLRQNVNFSPFSAVRNEDRAKLSRIILTNPPEITEHDRRIIMIINAKIRI